MSNKQQPESLSFEDLLDDGELTLEELNKIAGGQATEDLTKFQGDLFSGDVQVPSNIDSAYTAFFGAIGTSKNEGMVKGAVVVNLTSSFP